MADVFTVVITTQQRAELLKTRKVDGTSWHDHYLFLIGDKNFIGAYDLTGQW